MCNCKGWDVAFYPDDEITVEQHFCRVYGDCGHVDNTLEEAADQVVKEYEKAYEFMQSLASDPTHSYMYDTDRLMQITGNLLAWKNRTHSSYLWYKGEDK